MRLTIEYPDETPVWLSIGGSTQDGRFYGPSVLPDPPRPLAHDRETVLLQLPDAMDGEVLVLNVSGLNEQRVVRMRGSVRTEVVRYTVQPAFVSLKLGAGCANNPSSSVYCTIDAGTGASPGIVNEEREDEPDAPPVTADASTEPDASIELDASSEPDAAAPEPEPDASIMLLRCDGQETCDLKCPGGAHCAIDCGGANDCKPTCRNATCEIDCGDAERCHPTCEGRAICDVTCRAGSCREVRCRDEAQCFLHCAGDSCDLQCEHEEDRAMCTDDIVACNRACPG